MIDGGIKVLSWISRMGRHKGIFTYSAGILHRISILYCMKLHKRLCMPWASLNLYWGSVWRIAGKPWKSRKRQLTWISRLNSLSR